MSQNHPLGWAGEVFKPVLMVVTSEKAREMCKKNNLTLSQMLKPFGRRLGGQDGGNCETFHISNIIMYDSHARIL